MTLQGIDISNHQRGIPIETIPADFIICKATEGSNYADKYGRGWAERARKSGKLIGFYYYALGGDVQREVEYFANYVGNGFDDALICLDWERGVPKPGGSYNGRFYDMDYLSRLIVALQQRFRKPIVVYFMASVYNLVAPVCERLGCPMWVAQYANYNTTGYQDRPWNEGRYKCLIRQYSSSGRLPGFGSRSLDLDKFYGSREDWIRLTHPTGWEPEIVTENGEKMTECFVHVDDNHSGLNKGTLYYWNVLAGIVPLAHWDEAVALEQAHGGPLPVVHSGSGAPWVLRLLGVSDRVRYERERDQRKREEDMAKEIAKLQDMVLSNQAVSGIQIDK